MRTVLTGLIASLLLATSCMPAADKSGSSKFSVPDAGALRARVDALYSAEQAEDWRGVFALLPPKPYSDISLADFIKESGSRDFKILSFRAQNIRPESSANCVEGDHPGATVKMDVTIERFATVPEKESGQTDKWVYIDGEWYWCGRGWSEE